MQQTFKEFLEEALKTNNPSHGYSGQLKGSQSEIQAMWKETFGKVQAATGEKDELKVRNYLDSAHGRHLASFENDAEYIKKDFKKFSKTYKPEQYD